MNWMSGCDRKRPRPTVSVREAARAFVGDESGTTAIEYSLIAAGISIAIASVVYGVGSEVSGMFGQVKAGF